MSEEISVVSNKYIAYFPEFSPTALQQLHTVKNRSDQIPAIRLFLARYKAFPCLLSCPKVELNALFHIPSILNYLKDRYGYDITNDIILRKYHKRSRQFIVKYVFQKKNQFSIKRFILSF